MKRLHWLLATIPLVLLPRSVRAQDIEVPILVMEAPEVDTGETDEELDLANLVTTAAKGVTTVQEAPAIITIIPGDELRDLRTRNLEETLDIIPGFLRYGAMHGQFPFLAVRGTLQAILFLRDGVSMFDGAFNAPSLGRGIPLETIKRIELVSGPGGVLWGANSFLGIANVITKDAEDVDGIEASAGLGDGDGDRGAYRGYVMAGLPRLFGSDDVKLFAHASFESYVGTVYSRPNHMFSTPLPNPNSLFIYGPSAEPDPKRSVIFNFDGKLSVGKFNLYWAYPYMERYFGFTFPGALVLEDYQEDRLRDANGMLECTSTGRNDPVVFSPDRCIDRGRAARQNAINWYERYGILEWRDRFSRTAGATAKAYFIEFRRKFEALQILPPVPSLLEGGLSFEVDGTNYRAGASFDGDVELSKKVRLLYGGEAFNDWWPDTTTPGGSRQGAGTQVIFWGPYDLSKLPLPCPRTGTWDGSQVIDATYVEDCPLTFTFKVHRTVFGAFASAQYRPTERLILDGGVRLQVAPDVYSSEEDQSRGYPLQPIVAAAAVYEFVPNWHVKLNYTEGFRPPVFNNTDSNGQAVEIDGRRDLEVEHSQSFQTEINARLLKGKKRIRELNLRADYSYTVIENFITFVGGRYENVGDRGIHSAEFLSKLYLKGGHRMQLGYTWVATDTADKGAFWSMPEHWFHVASVVRLGGGFEAHGIVRVIGAFEDPNRRVEHRGLMADPVTGHADPANSSQTVAVQPWELVVDRIPPGGELQLGLTYTTGKLSVQATAYNALNARHFQPDAFNDHQPRLEILPNAYEDFRFFASATYSY